MRKERKLERKTEEKMRGKKEENKRKIIMEERKGR